MYNEAKNLYEKIKLTGYKPSEQELKSLEGTKWHDRLHGSTAAPTSIKFKAYYEDGAPAKEKPLMVQSEVAAYLVDKIEDQFDAHFSSDSLGIIDISKLPQVKQYALGLLNNIETGTWVRNNFVDLITNSKDPNELLLRLSLTVD